MAESESIKLVAAWREGDQQAAAALFERYAKRLIALANSRLSARLAARVDPQDVIQSVYCSFFVGARDNRFVLQESGDLWRLLVAITIHKVHHQVKFHTAGKRTVQREANGPSSEGPLDIPVEMLADEPSPAEAVVLADTLEEVMRRLQPLQRRMVELRLQGHSVAEIVNETQRSRATVERLLERVKRELS
jgi:RNA polymerase sigma factor (sigma-70 family)